MSQKHVPRLISRGAGYHGSVAVHCRGDIHRISPGYGRWMTQKVTGQQRNHCRGLRSPSPLWLKLRCTYFSSPHKRWSDCSLIVANHSLGGGTWCHPHNLQWGFLTVTGKKPGRPFTHGPEPERRAWFKPVCMAHFLHDELQMLTKRITLTAPQTTSGASLCSFIIAFPSYLGSQISAAKLPSRRCSAAVITLLTPSQPSFIVHFLS